VLFGAILAHWEHKGPAELPTKRTFTYRQVMWVARRDGIALRFPPRHPFNPIKVLRLAVALGGELAAIRTIFRYIWAEGGEVDTDAGFAELARSMGVADAEARVSDPAVKEALKKNGDDAIAAGVFGVPTIAIGAELFWGYDSTAMAADYLRDPGAFLSTEMRRVDALPVGVRRQSK
jgi:2-hydroxychromene-2-carboxylate isomerase